MSNKVFSCISLVRILRYSPDIFKNKFLHILRLGALHSQRFQGPDDNGSQQPGALKRRIKNTKAHPASYAQQKEYPYSPATRDAP